MHVAEIVVGFSGDPLVAMGALIVTDFAEDYVNGALLVTDIADNYRDDGCFI